MGRRQSLLRAVRLPDYRHHPRFSRRPSFLPQLLRATRTAYLAGLRSGPAAELSCRTARLWQFLVGGTRGAIRTMAALHLLRAKSLLPRAAGHDWADVVASDRGAVLHLLGTHRPVREECNAAAV